jgi:glycosyltransferase involved in cell wall biosynthesis
MPKPHSDLPRLLYVGDVAVVASFGGSLLLHRLLIDYPKDKLRILESDLCESATQKRLPDVVYKSFSVGNERLLRTRVNRAYSSWLVLSVSRRSRHLKHAAREFGAEAILTVCHGYSWLAAAETARKLGLPLHLVVHDEWLDTLCLPSFLQSWAEKRFAKVYRQAASRFCVSPYMVSHYRETCGVEGEVLYPSRAPTSKLPAPLPPREPARPKRVTFGYAGSIHSAEYARRLETIARVLQSRNGKILVFGPSSSAHFGQNTPSNLESRPPISSTEVVETLRSECDVLVIPMAFATQHARNMRVCFPSKLVDYSATGLPLLIWGPPYSSANAWAAEEGGGAAEVVETEGDVAIEAAVLRLVDDESHRKELGLRAHKRGEKLFSHFEVTQRFFDVLSAFSQ